MWKKGGGRSIVLHRNSREGKEVEEEVRGPLSNVGLTTSSSALSLSLEPS